MEFGNYTAEVLVEALPYIKKFYGNTIVIKYGGHAMVDKTMREKVISDIVLMRYVGMNPVIVHGGGPDINYWLEKEHYQCKFVDGLRVTDSEVLEIAQMVLIGKVNQEIVALLQKHGGNGVGFSGIDGGIIQARKKKHYDKNNQLVDLGYVGEITKIQPELINNALSKEYIPVISPIGLGENGGRFNINGDTAAAAIAAALKADKFFLLTDTDGILNESGQRISQVTTGTLTDLEKDGVIYGGMIPKANCCKYAIENGVQSAHIINGQMLHSLLLELFTNDGVGTMVVKGDNK
ncbi:MAG: acetylglutamate kinase [Peptococcaceae bacterium]|nr:acetylglutamate kinase [Peptococcaceae bacterium]